jgi:hypothetical protein
VILTNCIKQFTRFPGGEFQALEQAITKLDTTLMKMDEDGELDSKARSKVKIEAMILQRDTDKYIQGHAPPRKFLSTWRSKEGL